MVYPKRAAVKRGLREKLFYYPAGRGRKEVGRSKGTKRIELSTRQRASGRAAGKVRTGKSWILY